MALLGAYWQDIQFQQGGAPGGVSTTAGQFRSGYSRCGIKCSFTSAMKTNQFLGGAITTGWISFEMVFNAGGPNGSAKALGGFGQFSSSNSLILGAGVSTINKLTLYKFNGVTLTALAAESGTSLGASGPFRFDMQVIGYGASATVNVYLNGALLITFTGDVTVSGMTNMDCAVFGPAFDAGFSTYIVSEVMVSSDDTRSYLGLQTLALTGAGTTNQWTNNTFSNINGTTFSDANPTSDNTNGDQQQYNITDPISPGAFSYVGVVQAARMAKSAAPAVTQVALGYNNGGSVAYGAGSTKALTTAYACYEQIDLIDPTTGVAFVQADMTAMQLSAKAIT